MMFEMVVNYQLQYIRDKDHFNKKEINYLFDSLLPVINMYNEAYIKEGT